MFLYMRLNIQVPFSVRIVQTLANAAQAVTEFQKFVTNSMKVTYHLDLTL